MSTAAGGVDWGALDEATDSRWATDTAATKKLRPYSVEYEGDTYSQADFLTADARYHNFTSGIGAGKTVAGLLRTIRNVEQWNPGEPGMILAPTTPALKNVILPELRKWRLLDRWDYYGPQSEEPGLHAPNGARILLESANNERKVERLRGPSIAWFWIDEAALVPKRAWDILTGRLRTGNYRNGFVTTTPKGFNWIYDVFVDSDTRLDGVRNVLGVPSHANVHNPEDYAAIVEDYEGAFYEQEVRGRFVEFEGLVYPWFSRDEHVVDAPDGNVVQPFYGVDWGFNNPSVVLACGETDTGQVVVLEEFHESRVTDEDLAQVAAAMQQRHGAGPFYCDPADPGSIETFQRQGLDALGAENDVAAGIKRLTAERDRLRVLDECQALINEFGMYRYPEDSQTNDEDPVAVNDHCLVAGTDVLTARGTVPIEMVEIGDYVLTRAGWRPVISAGKTNTNVEVMRVEFSDGTHLTGTAEHPIFTESKGYACMDALRYGDICQKIKSSTMAPPSTVTSGDTTVPARTTGRTASAGSTARSGVATTAKFPTDTSSTTRMATNRTHGPVRVVALENSVGTADVYNCTVAGQHEYYANGILVHNSLDALRYALFTHYQRGTTSAGMGGLDFI